MFDTRVKGRKGPLHFDAMRTDDATALRLAKQHLASIGEPGMIVTIKASQLCHSEPLVMFSAKQQRQVHEQGGFTIALPA